MSKTNIIIHFVFGTKNRKRVILSENCRELYKYIYGILTNLECHIIRINGIEDHVHILTEINPSISIADIMKKVKQASSHWLKQNILFPDFNGWGRGYFAVSVSPEHKEDVRQYIINQEIHHKGIEYVDELQSMILGHGMEWYDDEWT